MLLVTAFYDSFVVYQLKLENSGLDQLLTVGCSLPF